MILIIFMIIGNTYIHTYSYIIFPRHISVWTIMPFIVQSCLPSDLSQLAMFLWHDMFQKHIYCLQEDILQPQVIHLLLDKLHTVSDIMLIDYTFLWMASWQNFNDLQERWHHLVWTFDKLYMFVYRTWIKVK